MASYLTGAKQRESAAAELAAQKAEAKRQAEEKAEQEAARKAQNEVNSANSDSAPVSSGGWTTAAPGMVFYRGNSNKYYRMVKNPGNYTYMTIGEALGATPGHGNGSAKN